MDLVMWCSQALDAAGHGLRADPFWSPRLEALQRGHEGTGIHLAVFVEPFLTYIFEGSKTVESRFSTRRGPPFGLVRDGDVIFLKGVSGPVVGICQVAAASYFELDQTRLSNIRATFGSAMRAENSTFW